MTLSSPDKIIYQGHFFAGHFVVPLGQRNYHKYLKTFITANDVHPTENGDEI